MKLKEHYDQLWKELLHKFRNQQFEFDALIDDPEDTRYGITLLTRPSEEIKKAVVEILSEIAQVAPNQYYYPASDLHLTVLSIISCSPDFSLEDIDPGNYCDLITPVLRSASPFRIRFEGLTASPAGILVQGFPEGLQLNKIRGDLRKTFNKNKLTYSIDRRYYLATAHMTAIRFKQPFNNSDAFVNKIIDLKQTHFGECVIDELELVGNGWYQQKEKIQLIHKFDLK